VRRDASAPGRRSRRRCPLVDLMGAHLGGNGPTGAAGDADGRHQGPELARHGHADAVRPEDHRDEPLRHQAAGLDLGSRRALAAPEVEDQGDAGTVDLLQSGPSSAIHRRGFRSRACTASAQTGAIFNVVRQPSRPNGTSRWLFGLALVAVKRRSPSGCRPDCLKGTSKNSRCPCAARMPRYFQPLERLKMKRSANRNFRLASRKIPRMGFFEVPFSWTPKGEQGAPSPQRCAFWVRTI